MALIKCPECGNQISDIATSCPGCGMPRIKSNIPENKNKICFILGILSFFIGSFFVFANIYWFFYGIFFIGIGILNLILYKKTTYLIVAGMLYLVASFFSLITIPRASGKYFVFIISLVYSILFLLQRFKNSRIE